MRGGPSSPSPRRAVLHLAAVAAATVCLVASGQQPTFRTAANFVQVDVYPTVKGQPVSDLAKADFEVLEDGVPQTIATFEHVSVAPAGPAALRVEPRSTAAANDAAGDPRNRLFVIFLDTFHVTDPTAWHDGRLRVPGSAVPTRRPRESEPLGPSSIDKALANFLERTVGANDLVAPMSPELDARQMVFTRRPERFSEWLGTSWARRFSWDDLEPEEEQWALCYPPDDPFGCYRGIFEEMVLRRHERQTLRALEATIDRLGQLRDGRKAVLLVSEGWQLYGMNQQLARAVPSVSTPGCPPEPPAPRDVFVGPGGRLQTGADPRNPMSVDRHGCDAARLELSLIDNEREYRRLLDRANRETVSFYPIDPRGLAVFDAPIDARSPGPIGPPSTGSPIDDAARLRSRLEVLRNLASATDGFVPMGNDLGASLKRIADDLSEYYLLGYNATNGALDGKYRRITVRVKRPGVQVRARRGYLAPTEAEVAANRPAPPSDPLAALREAALVSIDAASPDRPVRLAASVHWDGNAGTGPTARLWTVVELGDAAARQPEWREGAEITVTVTPVAGRAIATGSGRLTASARSFSWEPAGGPLPPGDIVVQVVARAEGGATAAEQVRLSVPADTPGGGTALVAPRVFRRGPSTGLAYLPTADTRFRRTERLRLVYSCPTEAPSPAARLLDRRGQSIAVPVTATTDPEGGRHRATVEAVLASLAPGEYLVEVTFDRPPATRQTSYVPLRIVP